MKKVVGYARVSTDVQMEDGSSLDAQEAKLRAYCTALDLDLITVIRDAGYSAKSLERPGIREVVRMLEAGEAEGILVVRLDRLTRSMKDLWYLLERYFIEEPTIRSCSLLSINDAIDTRTAGGRLVLNVLMSVASWEREVISERTRETLAYMKENGAKLGRAPLETTSPQAVEKILELKNLGMTTRSIAETLNYQKVPTYLPGKKWYPTTVARVLQRQTDG